MPLFADLAAMQARFEERTLLELTDEADAGTVDAERIDHALESADALITSYVASRHSETAQFAGRPLLTDIACDYAFSLLWRSNPPEWVTARRKDALGRLADISAGRIKLDEGAEEASARPGQIHVTSDPQRFGRDKLDAY